MLASVIIPSTGRPEQLRRCIEHLLLVSPQVEVIAVIEHDLLSVQAVQQLIDTGYPVTLISREEHKGPVAGWNEGAAAASGDAFVLGADDLWFGSGWLMACIESLKEINWSGLIGFNDLHKGIGSGWADHYLVTRDYCKQAFGGVFCVPHYHHYFLDVEGSQHAMDDGKFVYNPACIVEHRHHRFGCSEYDGTYHRGDDFHAVDMKVYQRRRAEGWPVDYEAVF